MIKINNGKFIGKYINICKSTNLTSMNLNSLKEKNFYNLNKFNRKYFNGIIERPTSNLIIHLHTLGFIVKLK
jgi:hypothetical protein